MAVLLQAPYNQFLDADANPLTGGFVYTYEAGTDTPKATYTDYTGGTPASNPVELDAAGRADIWIEGSYKITVTDSNDVVIRTVDNITAVDQGGDMTKAVYDPANISQQLVGTTAVQTITNKTLTQPTITLKQSASPTPTAEGDVQWDTSDDLLVIGDGSGQKIFYPTGTVSSFTPTVLGASTAGTASYSTQTGTIIRISANLYYFELIVIWSSGTGTGQQLVGGFPITFAGNQPVVFYYSSLLIGSGKQGLALTTSGASTIGVLACDPAGGAAASVSVDAAGEIRMGGIVRV